MYICTRYRNKRIAQSYLRALSSVGSEHLPYKQGVTGSNPVGPTKPHRDVRLSFFIDIPKSNQVKNGSSQKVHCFQLMR